MIFSLSDRKLIRAVAELWVRNGGDATGFEITWTSIRDAVTEVMAEQEAERLAESEGGSE